MMTPHKIAIIGPGKVGTALGVLAQQAGYSVAAVGARRPETARAAAGLIGGGALALSPGEAATAADLVFLTVSDDALEPVVLDLAARKCFRRDAVVVHCSGALPGSILTPAREHCGASIASAHPLQTFPTVLAALANLTGAYWFCEGDRQALDAVRPLIEAMGSKYAEIEAHNKVLYHACAVFACNYLAALIDASLKCGALAGIEPQDALAALYPLIRATLENILQLGPARALTGPIARGDFNTISHHLEALDSADPALAALYRALGAWTIPLALAKGTLSPEDGEALQAILRKNLPEV